MKETVEYQVEWKALGERRYTRNFTYFKDKEVAMGIAAKFGSIGVVSVRVVGLRRKIHKVFPKDAVVRESGGEVITPAASGDKGKIDNHRHES